MRLVFAVLFVGPVLLATTLRGGTSTNVQLRGIGRLSGGDFALLEITRTNWPVERLTYLLAPGQREGEFEMLEIQPSSGTVKVNFQGESLELELGADSSNGPMQPVPSQGPFLRLKQVTVRQVLQLYQKAVQRTLLGSCALPEDRVDVSSKPARAPADLAKDLEAAVASTGIRFWAEGEKFTVFGREANVDELMRQAHTVSEEICRKTATGPQQRGLPEGGLPPGFINFPMTELRDVLRIYQELTGWTLLTPGELSSPAVCFINETPLSKCEAIFAMTAVIALNGVSIVPVSGTFLFTAPTAQTNKLTALLQTGMPVHSLATPASVDAGAIQLHAVQLPDLLATYERLSGQPVAAGSELLRARQEFRNPTPLTAYEALYGLDLLLGWNGLRVVEQPAGGGLKVVRTE
jgi:hypothetical protein